MLNPDMILIGESDTRAGDVLQSVYESACDGRPVFRRMNFVNAELTKISINTFVTTKISYANMLAEICERMPGADVNVVTQAVGSDSRIGTKYLRGALGYGGPCFPRDNVAFAALARSLDTTADLAEATDRVNSRQVDKLFAFVESRLRGGGTVGLLGLSYKPETSVIEASQPVALARRLSEAGYSVVTYDPKATAPEGARFRCATTAEECARQAELLLVTTPWKEFRELSPAFLVRESGRVVVVDCWRILPREAFDSVADVVYPGVGPEEPAKEPVYSSATHRRDLSLGMLNR
jgi:UDPglucose 6-dehydrogenase